ncbi:MAG: diaminobutyrate--2-oxoglutarate transaminase [Bdellovibrionales bacterium]|nr:diaminobutyrate--2-oxoglutarate transaminase [Bdellovibrionales bacterium]
MSIFTEFESSVRSYSRSFPTVFASAEGAEIFDESGTRYLDFFSGAGSLNYGHNHPVLKTALLDYVNRNGILHGLDMSTVAKRDFIATFQRKILEPRGLEYKIQFTGPTGTNANEAALKLARKITGRHNIISFTNAFHGVSLGSLSATGSQYMRAAAATALPGVTFMPYCGYMGDELDSLRYMKKVLSDKSSGVDAPAAVIVETVQAEGGVNVASTEWLRKLQSICHEHGCLLIVDDIQAGCGRTGPFFSFEWCDGFSPDIVTLSKSLSGYGLPFSLVLMRPELDAWKPGEHNGTFRGNNLAFVTATAAIEHFWSENSFEKETGEKGRFVEDLILDSFDEEIARTIELRGRGLMLAVDCQVSTLSSRIARQCFEKNLIIETSGPDDEVVKILPPLTITAEELREGVTILCSAINEQVKAATNEEKEGLLREASE